MAKKRLKTDRNQINRWHREISSNYLRLSVVGESVKLIFRVSAVGKPATTGRAECAMEKYCQCNRIMFVKICQQI